MCPQRQLDVRKMALLRAPDGSSSPALLTVELTKPLKFRYLCRWTPSRQRARTALVPKSRWGRASAGCSTLRTLLIWIRNL